MPYRLVQPVLDPKVRSLCARPYEGHAKGCPNLGQRDTCPPRAQLLPELLDLTQPVFAVWNAFPFGDHVEAMRGAHPDWSERQLRCCLYWQGTARSVLRDEVEAFLREHPGLHVLTCPEACGVDVTETMRSVGVELQWPPLTLAYHVALAGTPAGLAATKKEPRPGEQLGLLEG